MKQATIDYLERQVEKREATARCADCGADIEKTNASTTRFAPGMYFCNDECMNGFLEANS